MNVLAIDKDHKATAYGRSHYHRHNTLHLPDDLDIEPLRHVPESHRQPSLITCFELLQYLSHRELFLEALAREVDNGAFLMLSTPHTAHEHNMYTPVDGAKFYYNEDTLMRLLERFFGRVTRCGEGDDYDWEYKQTVESVVQDYSLGGNLIYCQKG